MSLSSRLIYDWCFAIKTSFNLFCIFSNWSYLTESTHRMGHVRICCWYSISTRCDPYRNSANWFDNPSEIPFISIVYQFRQRNIVAVEYIIEWLAWTLSSNVLGHHVRQLNTLKDKLFASITQFFVFTFQSCANFKQVETFSFPNWGYRCVICLEHFKFKLHLLHFIHDLLRLLLFLLELLVKAWDCLIFLALSNFKAMCCCLSDFLKFFDLYIFFT